MTPLQIITLVLYCVAGVLLLFLGLVGGGVLGVTPESLEGGAVVFRHVVAARMQTPNPPDPPLQVDSSLLLGNHSIEGTRTLTAGAVTVTDASSSELQYALPARAGPSGYVLASSGLGGPGVWTENTLASETFVRLDGDALGGHLDLAGFGVPDAGVLGVAGPAVVGGSLFRGVAGAGGLALPNTAPELGQLVGLSSSGGDAVWRDPSLAPSLRLPLSATVTDVEVKAGTLLYPRYWSPTTYEWTTQALPRTAPRTWGTSASSIAPGSLLLPTGRPLHVRLSTSLHLVGTLGGAGSGGLLLNVAPAFGGVVATTPFSFPTPLAACSGLCVVPGSLGGAGAGTALVGAIGRPLGSGAGSVRAAVATVGPGGVVSGWSAEAYLGSYTAGQESLGHRMVFPSATRAVFAGCTGAGGGGTIQVGAGSWDGTAFINTSATTLVAAGGIPSETALVVLDAHHVLVLYRVAGGASLRRCAVLTVPEEATHSLQLRLSNELVLPVSAVAPLVLRVSSTTATLLYASTTAGPVCSLPILLRKGRVGFGGFPPTLLPGVGLGCTALRWVWLQGGEAGGAPLSGLLQWVGGGGGGGGSAAQVSAVVVYLLADGSAVITNSTVASPMITATPSLTSFAEMPVLPFSATRAVTILPLGGAASGSFTNYFLSVATRPAARAELAAVALEEPLPDGTVVASILGARARVVSEGPYITSHDNPQLVAPGVLELPVTTSKAVQYGF